LHEEDAATKDGIPVTSVARTLLDYSECVSSRVLDRAIEEAERRGIFDLAAVERLIERTRGRRGRRLLSAAVAGYRAPAFVRSELERAFLDLCRDARLPAPTVNTFVAGSEVDMAWPEDSLVLELDGHEFHRTRAAFERDRIRDADLQLAGYRVLRVTHRRLLEAPADVASTVRALLTG
jgi:very-short-patch-repair endonuclease